jgi:hypothetical protein
MLVMLIGLPAVAKMTLGHELAARTGPLRAAAGTRRSVRLRTGRRAAGGLISAARTSSSYEIEQETNDGG